MPDYNVTAPDGTKFKITAPEGVTRDEILRRLAAQKMPPSDPSFIQNFMGGLTAPIRGAGQLLEHAGVEMSPPAPEGEGETKVKQPQPEESSFGYTLGSMGGGAVPGLGAFAAGPRIIGPVARTAIAGAVGGALQPVEEGEDFAKRKEWQIGEGLTLGFGLGWAGKAASAGVHALGDWLVRKYPVNIQTQAVNAILKRIEQDNKYGAPSAQQMLDLVDAANAGGKPMTLTDVGGKNLRSLAGHVTRAPGESRQMGESFFVPRDEGAARRLKDDIGRYVSTESSHDTAEALLTARSAASRPLYQDTDKLTLWSPRLKQFLDDPDVAKGMARGYDIDRLESLAEGKPFDPPAMGISRDAQGNIELSRVPTMRVLDMAKKGLDAMIADNRDPLTGRLNSMGVALEKARKAYVTELDRLDTSGVYRKARQAWGGYSASLDALRAGRQAFENSPQENDALVAAASQNDREFMRVGLADMLRERLGKAGFSSDESRAIIRNPWMRDQMRPFFRSGEDFDKFVDAVTKENVMAQTTKELLPRSNTAGLLAEDQSEGVSKMAGGARIARSLFEGRFFSAVGEMWRLHRDVSRKPDPALNEAIARILFAPDIAKTSLGVRLLNAPGATVGAPAALGRGAAATISNVVTPALAGGAGEAAP